MSWLGACDYAVVMFGLRSKRTMVDPERALDGRDREMPVTDRHAVLGTPLKPPFPEGHEQAALERLDADREPVHAYGAERGELRGVGLAGVDLDGDLQLRRRPRPEGRARRLEHAAERVRPPEPGRPATEVDRRERPRPLVPAGMRGDLGDDRLGIGVVRDLDARVHREVAVGAPAETSAPGRLRPWGPRASFL